MSVSSECCACHVDVSVTAHHPSRGVILSVVYLSVMSEPQLRRPRPTGWALSSHEYKKSLLMNPYFKQFPIIITYFSYLISFISKFLLAVRG
jgi:hypothetical protein